MYPISSYELAKAQVADRHRQAQRDALARAARRARRARSLQPGHPAHPSAVRRLVTALGVRASA
jgi:hypothetical protein